MPEKNLKNIILEIIIITAFFCLKFLLQGNMGDANEYNVLPFVKQYVEPNWIPQESWLNQPPGYRLPFILLLGGILKNWGFLAASIIGRLISYILIASGIVFIAKQINLNLPYLWIALLLFIYVKNQGIVAGEWLLGGVEPKSFSYGFLLFAFGLILSKNYRLMAVMLGLATTFHVLIGGWAFMAIVGWLIVRRRQDFTNLSYLLSLLIIYFIAGFWGILTIIEHLLSPKITTTIESSFIYVFIRSPHHLNSLSWSWDWWISPTIYFLFIAISVLLIKRQQQKDNLPEYQASINLAELTIFAFIPFILGVLIAPVDLQGKFLQYYPFRLGDILLPLNTSLLFMCALQHTFKGKSKQIFLWFCIFLIAILTSIQIVEFKNNLLALRDFPSEQQEIDSNLKTMYNWINNNTSKDAVIITPPVDLANFTWIAQRATISKFKHIPPTSSSVIEWYNRLMDLSGGIDLSPYTNKRNNNNKIIQKVLTEGYNNLTIKEVKNLMNKYNSNYFLTKNDHKLDLPMAYSNSYYIIYEQEK